MNTVLNQKIDQASLRLNHTVKKTPLIFNKHYSKKLAAQIFFKREDLQEVRSFKIRGAYNKIAGLSVNQQKNGVVCASAGNHAQGVALSCALLKIKGTIYMPTVTSLQKIERVKNFGGSFIKIYLEGDTFDDANRLAQDYAKKIKATYVHAFDDEEIIAGQGTIAKEILEEERDIDFVFVPIGGGGLISGIASYLKEKSPKTVVVGCESEGTASMYSSLTKNKVSTLSTIDTFVDGTAVKTPGRLTFTLTKKYVDEVIKIPEGYVATVMIDLYQNDGIVTEPAGALSVAALFYFKEKIKGKKAVCVISGGNNDILRYAEILEKSLIFQGRKHYFIIQFAQKPGELKKFVNKVLSPNEDIVRFEYIKKTNMEKGPALVGIELKDKKDYQPLIERLKKNKVNYQVISPDDLLYRYIV